MGFFLKDLGYYMPLGDHWDAQLLTDIYTGGSWAARVASNYNYRYRSTGSFSVSYQRQRGGLQERRGLGCPTTSSSVGATVKTLGPVPIRASMRL